LYIWVTSANGTNDATNDAITPISTAYSGNIAAGASAMNINGVLTGVSNATITSLSYDNPALTGSGGATRWSAVSNSAAGYTQFTASSFNNFEANAALPNLPNAIVAGTHMGLATANTGIDPLYFPAVTVPNGSTPGAWKVGQVNFTSTATTGASTLALSAGGLGITKSQTGATTDMTSFYSYGSATINVAAAGRLGDQNADGVINGLDIDIVASDIRSGLTYAQAPLANLFNNPNTALPVSQADLDHLVGSLVDINGGGAGGAHGTHYGDANLDAVIGQPDLNAVLQNFGKTGANAIWTNGNYYTAGNNDTVVGQPDLNAVLQNFGKTGGTGQISPVPEPSTIVLFAVGSLATLGLVRRRR
jgi:hypothetical protein